MPIYKIVAKVLANKLKKILPQIISPNQSSFILSRLINDNIIVTYETLHSMIIKYKGNNMYMALKLYMSKTYDII